MRNYTLVTIMVYTGLRIGKVLRLQKTDVSTVISEIRISNEKLRSHCSKYINVASSILGYSEQVNERYYTYDVSNMDYRREVVENIDKNI